MRDITKIGTVALALALATDNPTRADNPHDKAGGVKPGSTTAALTVATPDQVRRDIQQTFGFMPQFLQVAPDALLAGFWTSLKSLQMNPDTALDAKTKELIGLAVAAQIPCEYCVYFHTAAARKAGATEQEVKEAIGMAAVTRMGSTLLNGSQLDTVAFKKEADRIIKGDAKAPKSAKR